MHPKCPWEAWWKIAPLPPTGGFIDEEREDWHMVGDGVEKAALQSWVYCAIMILGVDAGELFGGALSRFCGWQWNWGANVSVFSLEGLNLPPCFLKCILHLRLKFNSWYIDRGGFRLFMSMKSWIVFQVKVRSPNNSFPILSWSAHPLLIVVTLLVHHAQADWSSVVGQGSIQ